MSSTLTPGERVYRARAEKAEAECARLRSDLREINDDRTELSRQVAEWQAMVAAAEACEQKSRAERDAAELQNKHERRAAEAARAEVSDLRGRLARAASNGPVQNQVELVRDLSDSRAYINSVTAQLALLRDRVAALADKWDALGEDGRYMHSGDEARACASELRAALGETL